MSRLYWFFQQAISESIKANCFENLEIEMYEATASEATRQAIQAAHDARARAASGVVEAVVRPFRALRWPQDTFRRWRMPPQNCPAGQ